MLNVGLGATLSGGLQVVLTPELFDFIPSVGDTFDMVYAQGGLSIGPAGLQLTPLMSRAGAQRLGLSLPAFTSGFADDPNQLVILPSGTFSYALLPDGKTLRITLTQPVCAPIVGPLPISSCISGNATFRVTAAGSGPFAFQWQVQAPLTQIWLPLTDGQASGIGSISGAATSALTISYIEPTAAGAAFRCNVSSPCGASQTTPVDLSAAGRCSLADIVGTDGGPVLCGDATVDGSDFVAFINSFAVADPSIDPLADVAGGGGDGLQPDGIIDGTDFVAFINAFAIGC